MLVKIKRDLIPVNPFDLYPRDWMPRRVRSGPPRSVDPLSRCLVDCVHGDELARTDATMQLRGFLMCQFVCVEIRGGRIPVHPGRREPCAYELDVQSRELRSIYRLTAMHVGSGWEKYSK